MFGCVVVRDAQSLRAQLWRIGANQQYESLSDKNLHYNVVDDLFAKLLITIKRRTIIYPSSIDAR